MSHQQQEQQIKERAMHPYGDFQDVHVHGVNVVDGYSLLGRMTRAQRDAMGDLPLGALVYCIDEGAYSTWSGASWTPVAKTPTDKGSIPVGDGTDTELLPVGSDGQVLSADSAAPTGVKWVTPSSGGGGSGATLPTAKGAFPVGNGATSVSQSLGTNGQALVVDTATPTGIKWTQLDHTALANIGTNTHAQIDAALSSYNSRLTTAEATLTSAQLTSEKGQPGGYPSLDGTGKVPSSQLPTAAAGYTPPTTKGVLITGNGSASTNLTVGTDTQSIVADSTTAAGIKWAQLDHVNLANKGVNTHAQIDTFIASKGATNGLASLDGTGKVTSTQLPAYSTYTPPITKGILTTGNGSAATTLAVGASNNQLLTVDSTAATGLKWAQGDHTTLTNIGTNTHAQIDTFIASKGANSGLASLDGTGQVPSAQLGNVVKPVTKGQLLVGNGTVPATLGVGTNNQTLVADSTQTTGIKWAQGDHTTLSNIGTNTHAQLDTFVASKGAANGLATLDASGQVPASQLSNAPSGVAAGTLVTNTFTGAGTFDLWSRTLATSGSAIGVATEAFVAANQGVLARTGTWLLLHTVGSSLGIPDTSTPTGVLVSSQSGSALTGTSAQFAVTSGNGSTTNGDVILRVTQDRTTTWTAIVRSISSNVTL